jgi:glycerol-3-phosphate cytidylyltransferase
MKKMIVYTCGVFDMFHIGHLNMLRNAKGLGDILIVAVSTDELVESYKPGSLIIPYEHRSAIISSINYVDVCIPQTSRDKYVAWQKLKYDVLVVGDDWYGKSDYEEYDSRLSSIGVKTVYLPYSQGISSTKLRGLIKHTSPNKLEKV